MRANNSCTLHQYSHLSPAATNCLPLLPPLLVHPPAPMLCLHPTPLLLRPLFCLFNPPACPAAQFPAGGWDGSSTELYFWSDRFVCQQTNTKDIAGQSASETGECCFSQNSKSFKSNPRYILPILPIYCRSSQYCAGLSLIHFLLRLKAFLLFHKEYMKIAHNVKN